MVHRAPDGTIAYAENPPKKYQDIYPLNFDNDPAGLYAEVLRRGAVLDFARRQDLPGGQPAHQAAQLQGLADRQGQERGPRRAVPRRGVHPPGPAVRPGQTRLHPVLFVFHLAHRRSGSSPSTASRSPSMPTARARTCSSTPPTSCTRACSTAARHVRHPGGAGLDLQFGVGGVLRLRTVRAPAVREGSEEYLDSEKYELRPRDFEAAVATGQSLEPFLGRLNEIRRLHPRRWSSCAPSSSIMSTTTRCWPTASSTR